MFDFKKNKQNFSGIAAGDENQNPVLAHTMRDDLNAASGEAAPQLNQSKKMFYEQPEIEEKAAPGGWRPSYSKNAPGSEKAYSFSPFLNNAVETPPSPPPPPLPPPPPASPKSVSLPNKPVLPERPKHIPKWSRVILWSSLIIAFAALITAGYYFWVTRMTPAPLSPPAAPAVPEPEPVIIEQKTEKFSAENPNYLPIDTEKDTAQTVQQSLLKTAAEIKEANIDAPVEFIIVDQNNNPISLAIFSALSGLKLTPAPDNLEENFSLFIYLDSEKPRLGLTANFEDQTKTASAMTAKEKTLISDVSFLFLGETPQKTKGAFNVNNTKIFPIRYTNLDANAEGLLSVDYSLTNKQLIIATSKNAMWAILDKVGKKE